LTAQFSEEFENILTKEEANNIHPRWEFTELLCVGAGIGKGTLHTGILHVLKCKDAMAGKGNPQRTQMDD
jgi:hypothetical protein